MMKSFIPAGIRFGIVRGISYGLFGKPDRYVAKAREPELKRHRKRWMRSASRNRWK